MLTLNINFEAMKEKMKEYIQQYNKGGFTYKELEWELLNLYSVSGSVIDVLKQMAECPNTVDSATVPKAGIEAAPEQVVVNLSVNYTKYKRLLEVVKHYR